MQDQQTLLGAIGESFLDSQGNNSVAHHVVKDALLGVYRIPATLLAAPAALFGMCSKKGSGLVFAMDVTRPLDFIRYKSIAYISTLAAVSTLGFMGYRHVSAAPEVFNFSAQNCNSIEARTTADEAQRHGFKPACKQLVQP